MKKVYVVCEGLTERRFVEEVLYEEAFNKGLYLMPVTLKTKIAARTYRGGTSKYSKIRDEIIRLCYNHDAIVTSMIDFYQLPKDTPGYSLVTSDHVQWALAIEDAVNNDIKFRNIHFNLIVHEFETLLYADPDAFSDTSESLVSMMKNALEDVQGNPEKINNSYDTSPSHRIINSYERYSKQIDGIIVAKRIGVQRMRETCPHFNAWLTSLGI